MTAEPHAYAVEVLVNPGTSREYWRLDDEADVSEDTAGAEYARTAMVDSGYDPAHLRVVSLTVVDPDAPPEPTAEEIRAAVMAYVDRVWPADDLKLYPALLPRYSHRVNIMRALGLPT